MLKTSIGRLRTIALIEGISFIVLLGIAMPLKYLAGMPQAVTFAGWLHGMLFIAFCIASSTDKSDTRPSASSEIPGA